jgi:hypothetical protein
VAILKPAFKPKRTPVWAFTDPRNRNNRNNNKQVNFFIILFLLIRLMNYYFKVISLTKLSFHKPPVGFAEPGNIVEDITP